MRRRSPDAVGQAASRGEARQDKPRQGKPRQDKPRQDKPPRDYSAANKPRFERPQAAEAAARSAEPRARPVAAAPQQKAFEGERVAKAMARAGACSRRDAEQWIAQGRVAINGEVLASPAVNVRESDIITVDGKPLAERERTRLFLFHKPAGLVVSAKDPEGRDTVFDHIERHHADMPRVVSVGRLDINTEGLLLLTNDGGLARVLELPATGWTRRYRVRAHGDVDQAMLDTLAKGVTVDDVNYAPIEARLERCKANAWISMTLTEGKNREIKRVLEHLRLDVTRLIRISFGPFQLGEIAEGAIEEVKLKVLRDQLGKGLAELANVDFSSSVREPRSAKEEQEAREHAQNRPRKHVSTLRKQRDQAAEKSRARALNAPSPPTEKVAPWRWSASSSRAKSPPPIAVTAAVSTRFGARGSRVAGNSGRLARRARGKSLANRGGPAMKAARGLNVKARERRASEAARVGKARRDRRVRHARKAPGAKGRERLAPAPLARATAMRSRAGARRAARAGRGSNARVQIRRARARSVTKRRPAGRARRARSNPLALMVPARAWRAARNSTDRASQAVPAVSRAAPAGQANRQGVVVRAVRVNTCVSSAAPFAGASSRARKREACDRRRIVCAN